LIALRQKDFLKKKFQRKVLLVGTLKSFLLLILKVFSCRVRRKRLDYHLSDLLLLLLLREFLSLQALMHEKCDPLLCLYVYIVLYRFLYFIRFISILCVCLNLVFINHLSLVRKRIRNHSQMYSISLVSEWISITTIERLLSFLLYYMFSLGGKYPKTIAFACGVNVWNTLLAIDLEIA